MTDTKKEIARSFGVGYLEPDPPDTKELIERLRVFAADMDKGGYTVWSYTCMYAADELERTDDFDAWQANPYTKVLQKSIAEDYVPRGQTQEHKDKIKNIEASELERLTQALAEADKAYNELHIKSINTIERAEAAEAENKRLKEEIKSTAESDEWNWHHPRG